MRDNYTQTPLADQVIDDYTLNLSKLEVDLYQDRMLWCEQEEISRYFQSTPLKAAMSRLLAIAALEGEGLNKLDIAVALGCSRQMVHNIVEECLNAGWFVRTPDKKNTRCFAASPELVESVRGYAEYVIEKVIEHKVDVSSNIYSSLKICGYV